MASWSRLLRSSVLVLVCTYSSFPATAKSTSGSHFCNNPQLSQHIGLNLFNIIELVTFPLFFSVAGTRSHMEQDQGSREGVRATECCVLPEIQLW